MFTKHLVKVLFGFCAMILLGLASLVAINMLSGQQTTQKNTVVAPGEVRSSTAVTLPPIKTVCCKTTTTKKKD